MKTFLLSFIDNVAFSIFGTVPVPALVSYVSFIVAFISWQSNNLVGSVAWGMRMRMRIRIRTQKNPYLFQGSVSVSILKVWIRIWIQRDPYKIIK